MRGAPLPTRTHWRSAIIAGALLFLLNNSMIVWAQANGLPSGITAVMLATVPMWVVLIKWLILRAQRPSTGMVLGIGLGLLGIILLANPADVNQPFNPLLILSTLGAALAWAAGSLYTRNAVLPASASLSTGMQLFTGGVMLLILSIVTGDAAQLDLASITPRSLVAMLHLLFSSSIFAFSAYLWLIRVTTPERASTYAYVNPVVAVFLGWLLAGETLQPITFVAVAVIIAAVFLITTDSSNRRGRASISSVQEHSELALDVDG
jgi:drug/metabolite transporter (DMT)-like permease